MKPKINSRFLEENIDPDKLDDYLYGGNQFSFSESFKIWWWSLCNKKRLYYFYLLCEKGMWVKLAYKTALKDNTEEIINYIYINTEKSE